MAERSGLQIKPTDLFAYTVTDPNGAIHTAKGAAEIRALLSSLRAKFPNGILKLRAEVCE